MVFFIFLNISRIAKWKRTDATGGVILYVEEPIKKPV